jgi:hypothetical protein
MLLYYITEGKKKVSRKRLGSHNSLQEYVSRLDKKELT